MDQIKKIAVIGSGSWGTAIVKILSEQEDLEIRWWIWKEEERDYILQHGHNREFLSSVSLDLQKVKPLSDLEAVIAPAEVVILVVPSAFVVQPLQSLPSSIFKGKKIVSAIKGMIPDSNQLVTDYVHERFGVPLNAMAVIAGPCHAEEVGMERQSYLTIAGESAEFTQQFAQLMDCHFINCSTLNDLLGVEYTAVMKNIVAMACGIAHGLNNGDNFQAVLVTNAMQEIKRFVDKVWPKARDMNASAYLGDLLVTAYSQFSRNRMFGNMIGRGYSVKSAQMEMSMIAEGYYAVKCIQTINAKHQVEMPVTQAVYNVLYEKISPVVEFNILKNKLR